MRNARKGEGFRQIVRELYARYIPVEPMKGFIQRAQTFTFAANQRVARGRADFRTESISVGAKRQLKDLFKMRPEAYSMFALVYASQTKRLEGSNGKLSDMFTVAANETVGEATYIFLGEGFTLEEKNSLLQHLEGEGASWDAFIQKIGQTSSVSHKGLNHLRSITRNQQVVAITPPVTIIPFWGTILGLGGGPS